MLVLRGVIWSFYFPHGKHICAIWWHGISTNKGDSYGHLLCSTYSTFIFILLWDWLYVWPSQIQTSWPYRHDTSRYFDDIFTIINPEFEKYIPDIYLAELQLNKANTLDKETSFFDFNIKVIGTDIHASVYDKRDDFGFPIDNFPWLSDDVPRLPSYGIYISQFVRCARCCTSVLDFHLKKSPNYFKTTYTGLEISQTPKKHLESSLDPTPNCCRNLVIFRSKNMFQKESLIRSFSVI